MEKEEYLKIFQLEDTHAWYVALIEKTLSCITDYRRNLPCAILDAGCGTGGLLSRLNNIGRVVGIDTSGIAIELCQRRGLNNVVCASVSLLPFKSNSFNIITSLDVLYHRLVPDDKAALKEYYRVLDKGGILLLNLPAYEFLESNHDRFTHGLRRYTASDLKSKLKEAGFSIEKISYSNTLFFPIIALRRILMLKKAKKNFDSDLHRLSPIINRIVLLILNFENILQKKLSLPFGLSLFCIAKKA